MGVKARRFKLATQLVAVAFSALLVITSCAKSDSDMTALPDAVNPNKMEENYKAEVAWIHMENVPEVGEGLIYRQVEHLEDFVALIDLPIVLCQVEYTHESTISTQPFLEQLAEKHPEKLAVVMARTTTDDKFFDLFLPEGWPAFYLLNQGELVAKYFGYTEDMKNGVANFIQKYVKNAP